MEFWGFLLSAMLESRTARGFCDWIAMSAFNISHGLLGPVSYNHQLISFKSFSCPLFMFWCRCCVAVWHDTWWICMHVVSVGLRWGIKRNENIIFDEKQTNKPTRPVHNWIGETFLYIKRKAFSSAICFSIYREMIACILWPYILAWLHSV